MLRGMNLTLTKRADYVVRAALALGRSWGSDAFVKVRDVAAEMDLPRSYTPQVLGLLSRAGLAEAKAGREGGYRLTRAPERISLLELVEAGEGPLSVSECTLRGGPCRWEEVCAVHPAWARAADALRSALAETTLADVLATDEELEGGDRGAVRRRR